jgi:hypothetical protein
VGMRELHMGVKRRCVGVKGSGVESVEGREGSGVKGSGVSEGK